MAVGQRAGVVISRRDLLRAAGLVAAGIVCSSGATAAPRATAPRRVLGVTPALAPDPIADLAASLGYDAERIFRFVAEEVRYEPYPGVLRGPRGTLAGRAGNSADQALLLGALLDASLLRYRFATGTLDAGTAAAILAPTVVDMEQARQHGLDALLGTLPGAPSTAEPVLSPEQRELVDRIIAATDGTLRWANDRLAGTVTMIESALEEEGIRLPGGFTVVPEREVREHTWIQLDRGTDWLDLDPTLPDDLPGLVPVTATGTLDALPDALAHWVQLAVVAETVAAEGLTETVVLQLSERSDVLAGQPVTFMNVRPEGLAAIGLDVAASLTGLHSYLPTLIVGDVAYVGGIPIGFRSAGSQDAAGGGEGTDGLFDGTGADGEVTAEWIELTVTSPDAAPAVSRHVVFDRVGPAQRASGAFDPASLPLIEPADLGDGQEKEIAPAQTAWWLTVSTGLPSRDAPAIHPDTDDPAVFAAIPETWHLAREAAAMELAMPSGVRIFADRPIVMGWVVEMTPGQGSGPVITGAQDIWHQGFGTVPVAGIASSSHPSIVAGAISHVAERILGGDAAATQDPSVAPPVVSVGAIFERARADGVGLRLLRTADAVADLPYPSDTRERLRAALAAGWVAIAPERPVEFGDARRTGWWLVDPGSGRMIDQLDDGRGAVVDALADTIPAFTARPALQRYGLCLLYVIVGDAGVLELVLGAVRASQGSAWGAFGLGALGASGVVGGTAGIIAFCG